MESGKNWKPTDWIVLILALCVTLVLLFAIIHTSISDQEFSEEGSKTIRTMVTSMLSIIAMYIGNKLQSK